MSLPTSLEYGHVVGRIILAVADAADADRMPDSAPAQGTVTITPKNPQIRVGAPAPVLVVKQPITCTLDATGNLIDPEGALGVWLVTGVYSVKYSLGPTVASVSHDIEVLAAHTETDPLDLTTAMPPGGPILTASEYAELSSRIDALAVGAVSWDTIADKPATFPPTIGTTSTTALAGDTAIPSAPADIGAATSAQGTLADSAVQPADLDPYATDADLAGKADASHTHPVTDLTTTGTADATTVLHGDGSWKTAATGGGGGGGYPQVAPPGARIFFPPFTSTGTANVNNNVYLTRLDIPFGSIFEIGVDITTAQAGGSLRLGLYAPDANGSLPSGLLVDAGTVDASTTGWKVLTLATPISWTGGALYGAVYRPTTSATPAVRSAVGGSQPTPVFLAGSWGNFPTAANTSQGGLYMPGNHDAGLPGTFAPATQGYQPMFFGVRVQ